MPKPGYLMDSEVLLIVTWVSQNSAGTEPQKAASLVSDHGEPGLWFKGQVHKGGPFPRSWVRSVQQLVPELGTLTWNVDFLRSSFISVPQCRLQVGLFVLLGLQLTE